MNTKLPLFCLALALAWQAEGALAATKPASPMARSFQQRQIDPSQPVLLEADEVHYDQQKAIVLASGNVEVTQGSRILRSQTLTYDQKSNVVTAKGKVSVLEPDGNVYFAHEVRLKQDMKQGVIHQFRARLSDNSLFAANEARRLDEHRIQMKQAVYSPCKLCANDPKDMPLWQIAADDVLYDDEAQRVKYRDAWVEFEGVPIFYTPYFSHPTPDADRKTGVLIPTYKVSSQLGGVFELPVYLNLMPEMDATLTPILTSREGPVIAGEFRHLTPWGQYEIKGSATNADRRDDFGNRIDGKHFRGYIEGNGRFNLDEHWDLGFDAKRASDQTYLLRYDFGEEDTLTSRVFLEGMKNRGYASLQALSFQSLRPNDDPGRTPVVAPLAEVSYETDPLWHGLRLYGMGDAMMLTQSVGSESQRLSLLTGARLPWVTEGGQIWEFGTQVRGDIYDVTDQPQTDGSLFNGTQQRAIPTAYASWRYPFMRYGEDANYLIEPVAQVVVSPNGRNSVEIPNKDSQYLEFGDSNLFRINRSPGLDQVEDGVRAAAGLRGAAYMGKHTVDALLGQAWQASKSDIYPLHGGLGDNFSDYVGHVGYNYGGFADLIYRWRVAQDQVELKRSEIAAFFSQDPYMFNINYIYLEDEPFILRRQEIMAAASYRFAEQWSVLASGRRDLSENGGWISTSGGLVFENECLTVSSVLSREYTRDRDIEPSTSFMVQVLLKNLNRK
ncbi:MAG: LPS-assembly protein LptD [Alphaproteobacteria bacterium]|nr:LPS-assembly protein LptD [Alphaproteobacteria bacterium]